MRVLSPCSPDALRAPGDNVIGAGVVDQLILQDHGTRQGPRQAMQDHPDVASTPALVELPGICAVRSIARQVLLFARALGQYKDGFTRHRAGRAKGLRVKTGESVPSCSRTAGGRGGTSIRHQHCVLETSFSFSAQLSLAHGALARAQAQR